MRFRKCRCLKLGRCLLTFFIGALNIGICNLPRYHWHENSEKVKCNHCRPLISRSAEGLTAVESVDIAPSAQLTTIYSARSPYYAACFCFIAVSPVYHWHSAVPSSFCFVNGGMIWLSTVATKPIFTTFRPSRESVFIRIERWEGAPATSRRGVSIHPLPHKVWKQALK